MATKKKTSTKRKGVSRPDWPAHLFKQQAVAGVADPNADLWPAKPRPRPKKPTDAELHEFDENAQAILDAIAYHEWDDLDYLCTDVTSATGKPRRFTALEILALVDATIAALRAHANRSQIAESNQERMLRSAIGKKKAAMRWDRIELLRVFAREQHDARSWRSAQQAATAILPALLTERNRLGFTTPVDTNAEKWLLSLLQKHRRDLRKTT